MHILARLTAGVALAALLAIPPAAFAADPYEIQVILPVTGFGAFVARPEVNALGMIEANVNKAGGIRGRPIKFVIQDDQSNPALSVQLLNAVLLKKPPFIFGSTLSATCNAMAPLLKDGPVEYCFSPGIHPAEGSYVYSTGADSTALVAAAARYFRERGVRRFAVITSTDATGQDADRAIDAVFGAPENRALTIVTREHFNPTDINVAAQIAHVKGSDAEVLIAWTTGTPFATILRSARDAGLDLPVMSTPGNMLANLLHQYANIMPKELLFPNLPSAVDANQLPSGALRDAVTRFDAEFKAAGRRPDGEQQVWDAITILLGALQKLGFDATPVQVRDYVNGLRGFTGINGTYDFRSSPQRGLGAEIVIMQRWDPVREVAPAVSRPGGAPLK